MEVWFDGVMIYHPKLENFFKTPKTRVSQKHISYIMKIKVLLTGVCYLKYYLFLRFLQLERFIICRLYFLFGRNLPVICRSQKFAMNPGCH